MRVGCLVLAGVSVVMGQEAVKVSPAEISERRSTTFIKKENVFSSDRDGLTLKLHLEGPAVTGATKYGHFKITSGTDDVGTALTLEKDPFQSKDDFKDVSRFGRSEKGEPPALDVDLMLSLPARKASEIKALKGQLEVLAGGAEKVAKFDHLSSHMGKTLDDPVLKRAGLVAMLAKIDPEKREVTVEYTGKTDALQDVDVFDASGKKISNGAMSMNWGGKMSTTYDVSGPIDAGTSLQLHVMAGQKAIVVPFDLEAIKLP